MQRMQIWYINNERQWEERRQQPTCPFCRHPIPETEEEFNQNLMKRVEANDKIALYEFAKLNLHNGDYDGAFRYCTKAAELGDSSAHYVLSLMYIEGKGVEKDEKKQVYHSERAVTNGHPSARCKLGVNEAWNERYERAVKHSIIAANLGCVRSIQQLRDYYKHELVSKEDFAAVLRAHHAAVNAMKSPQREAAEKVDAAAGEAAIQSL